ncbi:MAG: hypothetical protein IJY04_07395 [Clostridia bacterium]|nr:hypothetical protein [Clostridia bacterium]
MKRYKSSFVTGSLITSILMSLSIMLMVTPVAVALNQFTEPMENFWILILLVPSIVSVVPFVSIGLLCTIITYPFKSANVSLTEEEITDEICKYSLHVYDVTSITLYLGSMGRYSSTPPKITFTTDAGGYICIERPSLFFIFKAKMRCRNASFTISELKKTLLIHGGIALASGLIMTIGIFFLGE